MPQPVDGPIRQLLTEVIKVLEDNPAIDRFKVTSALSRILASDDPAVVDWAIRWLRKVQAAPTHQRESNAPAGHIPLPDSADVPPAVRERYERPADDQTESDELAWCPECGQVCGHAGHRHTQGDHGETICEQCGVTLLP